MKALFGLAMFMMVMGVFSFPNVNYKCEGCVAIVNYVKAHTVDPQEVVKVIQKFCKATPIYKDVCVAFLEVPAEELVEWMKTLSAQDVCTKIHLCKKAEPKFGRNVNIDGCKTCKTVIGFIDDWIKTGAGKQELTILLDQLCKLFPQYKQVCEQLIEMEIDQLIAWITSYSPEKVCQMLHLCPKTFDEELNLDGCKICKKVIGFIESWIKSGAGKQEIKILLEQLCRLFPQYKEVCQKLIEMELDQLIEWITKYSSEQVCQMLHMCSKADVAVDIDTCSICKRVIGFIEDWLESGAGKQEIKVLLEALCAFMGPEYKEICNVILQMEIEQLIKWIESFSPEQVCQFMKLCPKTEVEVNIDGCKTCKTVIGFIDDWIQTGAGKQEIKILLDQLCKLFPQYKQVCEQLIEMEIDQLIAWITSYSPEKVCQLIHLCPKTSDNFKTTKCTICKVIYDIFREFLKNPRSEQEIITYLDHLCDFFPKYQSVCDELIVFGVMELAELVQQYDDVTVCKMVKLC